MTNWIRMKINWYRSRGTWLLALDLGMWRITITGYKEKPKLPAEWTREF